MFFHYDTLADEIECNAMKLRHFCCPIGENDSRRNVYFTYGDYIEECNYVLANNICMRAEVLMKRLNDNYHNSEQFFSDAIYYFKSFKESFSEISVDDLKKLATSDNFYIKLDGYAKCEFAKKLQNPYRDWSMLIVKDYLTIIYYMHLYRLLAERNII